MKAVILTAGYGKRMRPLTYTTHKTLLHIGRETVIERIINGLIENNINDIVIVTGYLKDKLIRFLLEKYPHVKFTFIHNNIYDTTNNIYSMALAFDQVEIDQDVILIESDLIYHSRIISALIESPHENIALIDKYNQGMDGTVVNVENGIITHVIPPHLQSADFDFSDKFKTLNIYKFSQRFASTEFKRLLTYYAKTIDDNCYYELILGMLIYMQREKIYGLTVNGDDWAEVDDPNDLNAALFIFERDKQKTILDGSFGGYWNYDITDFCFIRNMYFPDGAVLSELKNNMEHLLRNYGSRQAILDQKLAYYLLCKAENVICLNGAAQIYPLLRQFFKKKKGRIPHPTFGEYYRIFESYDIYEEDHLEHDLTECVQKNDDVIVFVNPNNPTGMEIDSDILFKLAKAYPAKLFIIDESFIEFSQYGSLLPILDKTPQDNIIIIKSLSKSLGLPGIRLGYVYSTHKDFIAFIRQNIPIWNMNSIAEHFLEIIIKHRNTIQRSFKDTIRDRQSFAKGLASCAIVRRVLKSGGNFITSELAIDQNEFDKLTDRLLHQHKIYVKDVSGKFNNGKTYMRLAVRSKSENARFLEILQKVPANLKVQL